MKEILGETMITLKTSIDRLNQAIAKLENNKIKTAPKHLLDS